MKEFIEKLIGKLEEKKSEHLHDEEVTQGLGKINLASFCSAKARALDGAIEIVNQLAEEYNNEFCEWSKENSNKYVCKVHAETHDSRVLDWCVCPYCGKKIKLAPYQPKGE